MGISDVSLTKIVVPPRRREILSRERLLNLLYDLVEKKLILISAPAGYGKTSLLIDLAHNIDIKVCWLSLDELDQEPQRFLSYFIACIARSFPQFGHRSTAILESLVSLDQGVENLLVSLANDIFQDIGEHFLVVLDDYQYVDDIPFIRDFISRFIQLVGENCHLLLSSRIVPALPDMLTLIARDQAGGLSLIELAFQPEEIQTLFQKKFGTTLSPEGLEDLSRRTEGWITGLYLSHWSNSFSQVDFARTPGAINVDVFDYLSQQVLEQQPPGIRNFLLETSLLDEFNHEMYATIFSDPALPNQDGKELVRTIQQNNLFVIPLGQDGSWFRYHHLFRDFLRQRMRQENPLRVDIILDKAVQYYSQRSDWEKAYFICEQRGDVEARISLVEKSGSILIQNDRLLTLEKWLDGIPQVLARRRPVILSLMGFLALVRGKPETGLPLLSSAETQFRSAKDIPNLVLCLVRIAWAHRLFGDYLTSMKVAEEALKLGSNRRNLGSLRAEAQRSMGLCLFRLGKAREAIGWLEKSLGFYSRVGEKRHASMVEAELGMANRALGAYAQARDWYDHALVTLTEIGDLTWQATLLNSMGVLHHAQGEYEQAVKAFEQGLECARHSGYMDTEALILTSLGDVYAEIGDVTTAEQTYQQAEGIARQVSDQFLLNYLSMLLADLYRQKKAYDQAFALLEEVLPAVKASGSNYECGLYYLISGKLYLASGNTQQAIWDLQTAIDQFGQGGLIMEHAWTRLWYAAACNDFGDTNAAQMHFKEASRLVGDNLPRHSLAVSLVHVQPWLDNIMQVGQTDPECIRLLDQARHLESDLPRIRKNLRQLSTAVTPQVPHIIIHTLGKAQVRVNGKLITSADWQTKSVRDLFFYFFIMEKPVTKEKVGAAFWPDITLAQLKLRFKNNLYRLRHALGQDVILYDDNFYRFNTDLDYESDMDQFESELALARRTQDISQQIEHYQNAVEMVQGSFLEDIHADWAWHQRERLDQIYLSATLALARLLLKNGIREEAVKYCQRAIDRDPCLEEAHQLAMQIYAIMHDKPAITRQYRLCQKILRNTLGSDPSHETEEVYQQAISRK